MSFFCCELTLLRLIVVVLFERVSLALQWVLDGGTCCMLCSFAPERTFAELAYSGVEGLFEFVFFVRALVLKA